MKKVFLLLILLFLIMQSFAQSNDSSKKKDTVSWIHQYTYDRLIQRKIFAKGMSDDEMAGILLYRGGVLWLIPRCLPRNSGPRLALGFIPIDFYLFTDIIACGE
jgi:hypothetical protein